MTCNPWLQRVLQLSSVKQTYHINSGQRTCTPTQSTSLVPRPRPAFHRLQYGYKVPHLRFICYKEVYTTYNDFNNLAIFHLGAQDCFLVHGINSLDTLLKNSLIPRLSSQESLGMRLTKGYLGLLSMGAGLT